MKETVKMVKAVAANILVAVFPITCIFPITWMFYSFLETDKELSLDILSLSRHPVLENRTKVIAEGNIGTYFVNSMFDTVIIVCIVIVISFVTGCYLSRFKFQGRTFVYYISLSGMLIPIYALLIPILAEPKALGLLNKKYTLTLSHIVFALPVGVLLVGSSVMSVPIEIEETACTGGSSSLHTIFAIVISMYKLVPSTCAILTLLGTWDESPLALVLIRSNALKTMPIGLANFVGSYIVNYPLMLAALAVPTFPVAIMYLLFYNQIMEGMMAGAVKG